SRRIHGITIKTSSGKRLTVTKHHLFRTAVSVSEQRPWMRGVCNAGGRVRRCGKNSQRRCVRSQHYFFDANTRLDHVGEDCPQNHEGDGRRNKPTSSASTHDLMLDRSSSQVAHFCPIMLLYPKVFVGFGHSAAL